VALTMALAHGVNDAYIAFLAPLLPRLMGKLGLSIALAATLAMIQSLASALLQPPFGYLADRYGRRAFAVGGPAAAAVFMSLIGVAPSFWVLALILIAAGFGSAAFHPPGASMAARAREGRGSGLRLSFFSFGGAVGYAAGPLLVVFLVASLGLEGLWVAMVPGLIVAAWVWKVLPESEGRGDAIPPPSPRTLARHLAGPLGLLFGISALAAFIQRIYLTLEPIIVAEAGGSESLGALSLTVYLSGQALGTLVGGVLTDRWDRQRLLIVATALACPAHVIAVLAAPGSATALLAAAAAGFLNMMLLPPVVVMAQEILPAGAAVGSGIVMGLAWAAGSVGVLVAGVVADQAGVVTAAAGSMPIILLGALLASHASLGPYGRAREAS